MFDVFTETLFELPDVENERVETLYLLQYSTWGHHSLAFHRHDKLIEFTYGDWDLFALDKRDLFTSIKNMLLPTPGTLGRKAVNWQLDDPICPLFVDCVQAVPFKAPLQASEGLFLKLETAYEKGKNEEVLNQTEGVYFVPYPESYSVLYNCNHALAKWLEQLGGHVSGRIFFHPDFIKGMKQRI